MTNPPRTAQPRTSFPLRLPPEIYDQVKALSQRWDISMNSALTYLLIQGLIHEGLATKQQIDDSTPPTDRRPAVVWSTDDTKTTQ